ncbi:Leucine-rich repeat domain-containing protein, variant 3 [Balamuthia mandrillaris]
MQIVTVPPEIGECTQLEELILYGCKTLIQVPRCIGNLKKLRVFCPYTSYRLHYFPYEALRCPLKDTTVSTRAIYGNYKNNWPLPRLPPHPTDRSSSRVPSLVDICSSFIVSTNATVPKGALPAELAQRLSSCDRCSKCTKLYFGEPFMCWTVDVMGTDLVPLLCHMCSIECVRSLPNWRMGCTEEEWKQRKRQVVSTIAQLKHYESQLEEELKNIRLPPEENKEKADEKKNAKSKDCTCH